MIGFSQRLRLLFRRMAPGLFAMALVIVSAVNFQIQGISIVMPVFPLMVVYYWAIYWPEMAPRWFVFLLGLFHDLVHLAPLGLSSLLLLLLWWVVTSQRRHLLKEPFTVIWLMFGLCGGLYLAAEWLVQSIIAGHLFTGSALWMRLIISVLFYPVLHKMLNGLHQAVLQK